MYLRLEIKPGRTQYAGKIALIDELEISGDPFDKYVYFDKIKKEYLLLENQVYASIVGANRKASITVEHLTIHLYHMGIEHMYRGSHLVVRVEKNRTDTNPFQMYLNKSSYKYPVWRLWNNIPMTGSLLNALDKIETQYSASMLIRHEPWLSGFFQEQELEKIALDDLFLKFPLKQPA